MRQTLSQSVGAVIQSVGTNTSLAGQATTSQAAKAGHVTTTRAPQFIKRINNLGVEGPTDAI